MDPTQDQDEGMIGPSQFKYSIKYQPTQDGIRVHMTGHGDDLDALGKELAFFYADYCTRLWTERGIRIAPLERPVKVMAEKPTKTKTTEDKLASAGVVSK